MFSRKGTDIMSTTEPIRDIQKLLDFKNYYLNDKPNLRNYTITVTEQKTGKETRILLNREAKTALEQYRKVLVQTQMYKDGNPYLFPSPQKAYAPISRSQAYRMITSAAKAIGIEGHISCHSLRKTFGYHAWKQGCDPVVIMVIFNHSSLSITKRYLCIEQDDKDEVYRNAYRTTAA